MQRFARCLVAVTLLGAAVAGCAPNNNAYEFRAAVNNLSSDLMSQYRIRHVAAPLQHLAAAVGGTATGERDYKAFVIDPFVDGDTGDLTETSLQINAILVSAIQTPDTGYRVVAMTPDNIKLAGQVVVGTIKYEAAPNGGRKEYHIYASILDLPSGDVEASSSIWVADAKLPSAPILLYRNSPMYLKDANLGKQIAAAQGSPGSGAGGYVQTLESGSITAEASEALEHRDYRGAIVLFNQSMERSTGRNMKNYAGLYQAFYYSNRKDEAAQAFSDLFALGVANNNPSTRFLFTVSSTEFIPNSDLPQQYNLWLRQIARFLSANSLCMTVVGHSSHTGTAQYNLTLSRNRADRILGILKGYAPALGSRLDAVGRGFDENIIGTGTDDDQDRLDRRVEFRLRTCT